MDGIKIWGTDNEQWTSIRHGLNFWDRENLRVWINENIEGDYRLDRIHIYFENKRDAVMFTLKYK